jgi:putative tricarboxylic transport membrane protein
MEMIEDLLHAFMGCLLGTLIGVLPGLGSVTTIAMLLPSIYTLDATPALVMLAGIYTARSTAGRPRPS